MKKFSILVSALIVLSVSFYPTYTYAATNPKNVAMATAFDKAPYILYTGKNTEMLVIWQMFTTTNCTIEWGTDENYTTGSQTTTEYETTHQHKYIIPGLVPGTKYFYKVTNNGETKTGNFTSGMRDSDTAVSFYAYGDTRTNPATHDRVVKTMMDDIKLDPKSQTFLLVNGDLVQYGSTEASWTNEFFDPKYTNIQELLSKMPYLTTMGNHEGQGILFGKYFQYPQYASGRFYYSFDYGPVHITVIDQYTDYSPGSAQYIWLENDLANSNKPWKMIVDHEPGWTAYPSSGGHGNNNDVQNFIQPLCLKYDVSFVFSGHNHFYSRADVNGVAHITSGGGGAPMYDPGIGRANIVTTDKSNHFCKVEIDKETLKLTVKRSDGSIVEVFDYVKTTNPGIMLTPTNSTLNSGNTKQLSAIIWPKEIANATITWSSNNTAVATVSETGLVSAIADGNAIISGSILGGTKIATANITISPLSTTTELDNCDELTNWKPSTLSLNNTDKLQGTNCLEFTGTASAEFQKVFTPTFNSGATLENGLLKFWYYVSDINKVVKVYVEIGSAGKADTDELSWKLSGLVTGWNQITLQTSNASKLGYPNLNAINWFRIYDSSKPSSITTRLDALQLGPDNLLSTNNGKSHSHSDENKNSINIYPNPYKNGILNVDLFGFESMKNVNLKISTIKGQLIYQEQLTNKSHVELNLSGKLTESVYFISVVSGKTEVIKKLITK